MHAVEVKGWRNGLLLILPPEGNWDSLLTSLEARLDEGKGRSFWRGSQATLDFGNRSVLQEEMGALVDRLKVDFGLIPTAVVASEPATRAAAEKLVLTTYETLPTIRKTSADDPAAERSAPPGQSNNAFYLPQTIRSGQRITHEGHLVICGDVNAGAEVMAAGDIVIFGTLRGLAHAGCFGDEGARIVAGSLRPPQLRIATKIARAPEEAGKAPAVRGPEVARIENGEIQIFPL